MRFYDRPFLLLLGIPTLAFTMIVVQGRVRKVEALIHRPKVLQPGPSSRTAATTTWATTNDKMAFPRPHRKISHIRLTSQSRNAILSRLHGDNINNKQSNSMLMAQGSIGMEKDSQRKSSPVSRYLLATLLAVVAMWKFKGVASLFFLDVLFKPYQVSLANNPLITKVLTGAILAIAGDAMAQAASNAAAVANNEKEVGYDKRRALSFAVFDSGYRFCQHHMFPAIIRYCQGNVIMNILPRIIPSKSLVAMLAPAAAAVEQTAVYQLGIVPFVYYPIFFAFTGFIQGLSFPDSIARMRSQFFPCWKRNLMFWIPTQMFMFGILAEKWQIPFACLMGMLWSMILSKYAGSTKKGKQN